MVNFKNKRAIQIHLASLENVQWHTYLFLYSALAFSPSLLKEIWYILILFIYCRDKSLYLLQTRCSCYLTSALDCRPGLILKYGLHDECVLSGWPRSHKRVSVSSRHSRQCFSVSKTITVYIFQCGAWGVSFYSLQGVILHPKFSGCAILPTYLKEKGALFLPVLLMGENYV